MKSPCALALVCLVCAACSTTGVSAPVEDAGAGIETECLREPVFDSETCIYRAGLDNTRVAVLIHGLGGNGLHDWRYQIPVLAENYHVITFDLPGFGASEVTDGLFSPANYVRFVRFAIERHAGDGPIHVVGHSMGAAIAAMYAAQYPDDVERLILASTAGVLQGIVSTRYMAEAWANRLRGQPADTPNPVGRITGKLLQTLKRLPFRAERLVDEEEARQRILRGNPGRIAGLALSRTDFSEILPAISAPTLIIWGNDDPVVPLRTGRILEDAIARARLEVIDGTQHMPMSQRPERFNALMLAHFTAHPDDIEIRNRRPVHTTPPATDRIGNCVNQGSVEFIGEYRRIDLTGCGHVVIRDAWIGKMDVRSSRVYIERTTIITDDIALRAIGSEIEITSSRIEGGIAIQASGSRLDIANTLLIGHQAAIEAPRSSTAVFSISWLESPFNRGPIHDVRAVTPNHPM